MSKFMVSKNVKPWKAFVVVVGVMTIKEMTDINPDPIDMACNISGAVLGSFVHIKFGERKLIEFSLKF